MIVDTLDRFIEAQEIMYETALDEIKSGMKRSHWIWYIFPQLRELGVSAMANYYGITGLDEAKAYMAHPTLSARLIEISEALLRLKENDPERVLGFIDAVKVRSCMTLFAEVSKEDSVFHRVLQKFYNGEMDDKTLKLIGKIV